MGRAGLDSVKLGKVICDFNKAEGLRGISCLGDGGLRWMEKYSWPGGPSQGQAGALGTWAHPQPHALQGSPLQKSFSATQGASAGQACLCTRVYTHTPWQDTVPYARVHKILKIKADVL